MSKFKEALYQGLGQVSVSWNPRPTGVFESDQAVNIGMIIEEAAPIDYNGTVEEFHERFRHPILNRPQLPSVERQALRIKLIQEELNELQEACLSGDLVAAFDALLHIQYVLSGAVLEFGMQDVFKEGFLEVHRSNMSKLCKTREEAEATCQSYLQQDGTVAMYEMHGDLFHVFRLSDRKTLKSIKYSKADLHYIINTFLMNNKTTNPTTTF